MADRYNNIDNTSPFVSALNNDTPKVPRSNFDYTRTHHGNLNIGTLEILDCFPTLPNSDYTISEDLLIKVRVAMKKRIMNGQRVYVHAWYMSYNDLWEAAQNHIDHGRSGLLDINKPYFDGYFYNSDNGIVRDYFTPNSVFNQLGVPVRRQNSLSKIYSYCEATSAENSFNTLVQDFDINVNALPAIMYQRIYLDKYAPKNLLQTNKNAYPDNAEKVRVPYNAQRIENLLDIDGNVYNNNHSNVIPNPNDTNYLLTADYSVVYLPYKRYRQKKGDYFVTSSPFADLLRGDTPTIDLAGFTANVDFTDVFQNYTTVTPAGYQHNIPIWNGLANFNIPVNSSNSSQDLTIAGLKLALNRAKVSGNLQTQVTANQIRTLLAYTLIKERNALTNGDYNSLVKAQFGYSPNVDDFSAKYIGGFYQDIVFSDVTQTSVSEQTSPLGNQAGQAMSANSGFIGKFHSNDYGYIMVIASIVPDEIYNQGIPRWLGELSSDEEYTSPILNNLPPQPIKYKELFLSNDESVNEDVFSYTQRYEHLRSRQNYASGFVGLGSTIAPEDSSYVQHKRFINTPEFNAKFVSLCPDNIDMTPYSVTNEPPYIFTCINNVSKVEPLPYDSMPSDLGLNFA